MARQYAQQWQVESGTTSGKFYTVSKRKDGGYECSCPAWIYRRQECSHIRRVKVNPRAAKRKRFTEKPIIVPAKVRQVTRRGRKLLTPLIPLMRRETGHFKATIVYDLLKQGVPWSHLQERYWMKGVRKRDVIDYIKAYGRRIESKESFKSKVPGFWKTEVTFSQVDRLLNILRGRRRRR